MNSKTYECGKGSTAKTFQLFNQAKPGYRSVEITETGDASQDGGSKTVTYYVKTDQYSDFQKLCVGIDPEAASKASPPVAPKPETGSSPEETFMLENTKTAENFYLLDANKNPINFSGVVRYTDKAQYLKLKNRTIPENWHRVSYGKNTFYFLNDEQYSVWSTYYTDNGKPKNNQKSS